MVEPGRITAAALDAVRALVAPGVTTGELDAVADPRSSRARGAKSNFQLVRGYRHTICASVNEQVVHGIPGDRVLAARRHRLDRRGRGVRRLERRLGVLDRACRTRRAPTSSPSAQRCRDVTEGSMWAGIAALATATPPRRDRRGGRRTTSRSNAPEGGYGILREYVGHGIGRKMHESPSVFNYRVPGPRAGGAARAWCSRSSRWSSSAIRRRSSRTTTGPSRPLDGSAGSHWEHSVAVHDGGIWVLTAPDGGAAGLAPFGIDTARDRVGEKKTWQRRRARSTGSRSG